MEQLKWKVCGMKYPQNIKEVAALQPDFMGLIFYAKSPRYMAGLESSIINNLNINTKKVGVFVNASTEYMLDNGAAYGLDYYQLHGDESVSICKEMSEKEAKVIKAFSVDKNFDFKIIEPFKPYVEAFLFDTKGESYGGNGFAFDWSILKQYDNEKPFLLSGGIDLENIDQLDHLKDLNIMAIDVNSRFELEPGLKDVKKLKKLKEKMEDWKSEIRNMKSKI